MKVKKDYGKVVVYWLDNPYWFKGMWIDRCIKLKQ